MFTRPPNTTRRRRRLTTAIAASRGAGQRGFTLIELLAVVAIIAVLAAMLLPALGRARSTAKGTLCRSNQRQAYLGLAAYGDDHDGYIPANSTAAGNWHYRLGLQGYLGVSSPAYAGAASPLGNTWRILECPSEYAYEKNAPYGSNYRVPYIQTSYALNWAFHYRKNSVARKGMGMDAPGCDADRLPTLMDCPAWNVGWWQAAFDWHVDDLYWTWDPFYPYRHSNRTANITYMDGHVAGAGSYVMGRGPRIFWRVYDDDPDGVKPPSSGVIYERYPY